MPVKRQVVKEMWDSYAREVLYRATHDQKRQLKQAFYAGATGLFGTIQVILAAHEGVTDEDIRAIQNLHEELYENLCRTALGLE